ncbi:PREDICTED: uncharacterized protein LOC104772569 [Camelina sativa]|uniref:Uncharacterized protein LOC104772569 n=1 Tax=Camelina sativa TaxID=90675 RepID=A0ABM0Y4R6_CAMSA|nr:PREDICTED: uncharacterized protein LOC104772569 [Camelina sativa]
MLDKAWVHLCRADPGYKSGAWKFVRDVSAALGDIEMIICPCKDCRNVVRQLNSVVVEHLVIRGMDEAYKVHSDWYHHGDVKSVDEFQSKPTQWNEEVFELYKAAEFFDQELAFRGDLADQPVGDLSEIAEGEDQQEDEFLAKIRDAETPLYPSCSNHSKLSAIVTLFRIKTHNGWSDKSFNELLQTLPSMLPDGNVFHTSLYDVKKFLKSFHMGYEKIDACVNDCCLFRKKLKKLDKCPKCNASRWKTNKRTNEVKKGVPQKVLRYFPIIPRLKRMFRSEDMAKDLRWHYTNKSTDGKLRHPVDSVTWAQMNEKYPSFAAEERNIRPRLSINGFNPFNMKNSNYSSWHVLLVNYNLPPHLCMKKENIMLTLLIPSPQQSGNNIDVYLEPLIEDLNHLSKNGELTYDAFSKSTFTLKAMLLWTISDFPAYGNLAGCKVKGKMGCPMCGKNTDSMWLKFSRKHVYMYNRKCLAPTHKYREKKTWFDGKVEHRRKSRILTGHEVHQNLKNFQNNFGNVKKVGMKRKRTVYKELVFDSDDDEKKNVTHSIVSTLLHCGKSKDGLNARKDLQHLGPDGYCSNISRGVSVEECKVGGLKSHDYHVLMQQLLPVALRGLLPKGPRTAILRLCAFFNHLCQRVIDIEVITVLEAEIVETLCMFERFFPPTFFDIMVHLTVHLGREARLGGPVHFRWMYPFERYMKVLKDFVRNPARPEGCIAESYLAEESMLFCNEFLKKTTNVEEKPERNVEYVNSSILEGRPISAGTSFTLTEMEKNIAHLAVIQNTAAFDHYVDMHLQYLQDSNPRCRRDATFLWSMHAKNFAAWLKGQISITSDGREDIVKWLAYGPRCTARSYTGYKVNGQRFHTYSLERQSQNSGVYYEATAMCRSSAKDTSQVVDLVSYYGRITDIILLDYHVFYVPIFRCNWAVKGNGVKVEDGFTLVNLNQSQVSFQKDPYILASQAKQVFYSSEDGSSWSVVMRGASRRYSKEDVQSGNADIIGPLPVDVDMDTEMDEAEYARSDCEGIYVQE